LALILVDDATGQLRGFSTETVCYKGSSYRVVAAHPNAVRIEIVYRDRHQQPIQTFAALREDFGSDLLAATNAGIFKNKRSPTGLLIAGGELINGLSLADGVGNFYLKPNGVFFVHGDTAAILESAEFARAFPPDASPIRHATQSGPLLISRGRLHPRLRPDSQEYYIRNAVGVRRDGTVILVLSLGGINLYDLANALKERFDCPDALYLDGAISRLHTAEKPVRDRKQPYAGFITVRRR
jgi:uncharacterized protein YigE (DUF2233 family)